jgi:hypothetical protein
MLAMKEQFPHLRNGGQWRPRDIDDIEVLRRGRPASIMKETQEPIWP